MEPEQHHRFPTDDEFPTAKAYLRIELTSINPGNRCPPRQVRSLRLIASLTGLIRQLLSKARP